jgi:putative transcriptional regulator
MKSDLGVSEQDTQFGEELIQSAREALAYARGELDLPVIKVDTPPAADRVRAIRRAVSKGPKDFERRFRVPARTLEGWEQGRRKPDVAARLLLTLIEREPEMVERVLADS